MAAGVALAEPRRAAARTAPGAGTAAPPGDALGAAEPTVTGAKGETTRVEASRLQQLIARRMAESKATIPHFQVQTEVAMDAAIALRSGLKASANGEAVPSLNDLIVKACAIALRQHPRANGSYADGGFELHGRINIGVAVAGEDALVVPVVLDADTKSLGGIARETRRLAARVRSGEISPPELSGGTFTVSNLGMFGMTAITPVINPPQAAILGVGALREVLARVDGEVVDRTLMTLTLSCDHQILYGADAARLLADVRTLLETPLGLAL
jgi:pyruvate dehydrogenase E2 component (dihydrolipoamide acetyltransferase)